ncbi:MAG: hypothetical protein NZM04_04165 [Methylacidiphilales bacterium]|nr:hypothetical protein [Candidatus Methylacidiphilales bacterium]
MTSDFFFPGSLKNFVFNAPFFYSYCLGVGVYNLAYSFIYHKKTIRAFVYSVFSVFLNYSVIFLFVIGLPSLTRVIFLGENRFVELSLSALAFILYMYFKNKKNLKKIVIWAGIEVKENERDK